MPTHEQRGTILRGGEPQSERGAAGSGDTGDEESRDIDVRSRSAQGRKETANGGNAQRGQWRSVALSVGEEWRRK